MTTPETEAVEAAAREAAKKLLDVNSDYRWEIVVGIVRDAINSVVSLEKEALSAATGETRKTFSYSTDEEHYLGSFDTPEAAAHEGFEEEYQWGDGEIRTIFVGENVPPIPPEGYIDADLLIEHVQCQEDYSGEWADDWPGSTKAQTEELTTEVRKVFAAWVEKHDLRPRHFSVVNVRSVSTEECGFVIPEQAPYVQGGNEKV